MVDLDNDSVYVHTLNFMFVGLLQMEYTHVQVGEVVNIHYSLGGMMVHKPATTGSYQTRDSTPNVLEVIAEHLTLDSGGSSMTEVMMIPDDDDGDLRELLRMQLLKSSMSDDTETQDYDNSVDGNGHNDHDHSQSMRMKTLCP